MKYFRTVVEIVVLSEDIPWDGELADLAYAISDGGCSGEMKVKSEEVSPKRMAELLQSQGSEPRFFQLDENGHELEED